MRRLRFAMLTTFYPPYSFGGDALAIERLSGALARRGHEVTVVHDVDAYLTLSPVGEPAPIEAPEGVRVIGLRSRLGAMSSLLTHQLGRPLVQRRRLRQLLQDGAFDVIWYHNISLIGGPGLMAFGDALKIYEAHEHWLVCPTHVLWRHKREPCTARQCLRCSLHHRRPPQLWRYSGALKRQLRHIDAFIAKSEFSRDKHREFGFPLHMDVVPYFVPDSPAPKDDEGAPADEQPYFLFVGRLEQIKGLDEVIPLFARYREADLLVVGSGEHEAALRRQAAGIPSVRFVGRVPPNQLHRYYRDALALIVPSVCYETFGIVLIEGFRNATPVIARRIGPFPEIVERCGGGALFTNQEELTANMSRMQHDRDWRASLSAAARDGFKRLWSEDAIMTQYMETLRRAALRSDRRHLAEALEVDCAR